jgi:predicted PurR-regulated permease PerM
MSINRIVEYVFFFLILATSGYLLWQVFSPFVSALALSMIIVTISYPLYEFIERHVYHNNRSLASALNYGYSSYSGNNALSFYFYCVYKRISKFLSKFR